MSWRRLPVSHHAAFSYLRGIRVYVSQWVWAQHLEDCKCVPPSLSSCFTRAAAIPSVSYVCVLYRQER